MSNKQFYLIITPLIIIGYYLTYYYPTTKPYAALILLLFVYYFGWKDVKRKLSKAKGEEEIRHIIVPIILLTVFAVIGVISLFMNLFT